MTRFHLAVALDGAGWHPAAWRDPSARPHDLFTAAYWTGLVTEAQRGLLDFVTIDDALSLQQATHFIPDDRVDQVRGRLDALLIAARVAPHTANLGIVPTVTTADTEPFHTSKNIATLDYVSTGRAGVQFRVGGFRDATHFGRRPALEISRENLRSPEIEQAVAERFDEAADYIEVVRRLWDSWEDGAEIRDAATGRFIDRDRLHRIDFQGAHFSVRGPSITPRPPQGQPLVTVLGHSEIPYTLAQRQADVVFVTPADASYIAVEGPKVFADLVVFLGSDKARLDELDGEQFLSDARIVTEGLADKIEELQQLGYDGVRLRPGVLPVDLIAIVDELVPELQRRGLFRTSYEASTLRGHLGLDRPASRYQGASR
ncbi:LLM class flavin-dependent oxidoreductase [Actinoplanes couchii]|uniref:FMNH2-utilizing oxygenase n=1 Tax=Actinoplanes couchii TaxID=403638 RepID=A0ABQ3XS86_9ACTN|nr:LLM class flavin-dependent oxidoreductase [Actinoplanes couchii]MDR6317966.1 alkanesulfonate monooxygenase SsuD/methylene tetrahydromethanopterin reductase-like flavin-dependent oxidoreductase (luciferase family) [Actinoplanes couchii]GID61376.1 FMNH2-utilizing oxygenase [Actinoplanes couchii]